MVTRSRWLLVAGVALGLQTGCWFGTGSTSDLRKEITLRTGVRLEPEFGMKLGRLSMKIAKMGVRMAHDDDMPSLKGISKLEIGVYNVVGREDPPADRLHSIRLEGWETLVRVRDGNERVQVLYQPEGDKIHALLVLVLDDEEFVVVRVRGKIHKFLVRTVEHSGWTGVYGAFEDPTG
jgi:hypothetical protein